MTVHRDLVRGLAAMLLAAGALCLVVLGCTRTPRPEQGQALDPLPRPEAPRAAAMPPGHPPVAARPPSPPTEPGATMPSPTTPEAPTGAADVTEAGGLSWRIEPPLAARPPASSMRVAEYGVTGEDPDATLAVFYFGQGQGGDLQSNLTRWMGQFTQPDGRPNEQAAQIDHREVNGIRVTTIALAGTFASGGMPGMPGASSAGPRPGYRLLGAIAEGPQGPVFFKLTGPAGAVEHAKQAFDRLLESLAATPPH